MNRTLLGLLALALASPAAAAHAQAAPAPQPAAAPSDAAQPAPAAPRARQSWTSDRRDYAVGDIITVLLDESMLATAAKNNTASDRRSRDLGLGASGSGMAASLPATGARVGTTNDSESRIRGESVNQSRVRSEISVRVVAVEPNGALKIKGEKAINLDKDRQTLALSGIVRPQDISGQNTVDSWRIADAQIGYVGKGGLGKPKGGIVGRILGAVWP
jgi:flagellar L-ring protein precursor FlgH